MKDNAVYYALGVLICAVVAVILYSAYGGVKYDTATFCPLDGKYPRTAIIIDATDSLNDGHRKSLQTEMDSLRIRLARHEWLGLYVLDEGELNLPKPLIALCNPGNDNTCNPAIANCQEAERIYKKDFAEPMKEQIKSLTSLPEKNESPIFEMLEAVVRDGHFDKSQKRRLIVVSDMLHHTGDYSHYGDNIDFATWQETDYARQFLKLPLNGADVEIWYIKRDPKKQPREHREFWEEYFNAVGATVREVKPL